MRKIIHISDPHCSEEGSFEKFGSILENIVQYTSPMPHDFTVVITGDLLDSGRDSGAKGFQQIKETILTYLPATRYRVLLCPGNHDYGTGSTQEMRWAIEFKEVFENSLIGLDSDGKCPWLDIVDEIAFIGLDSMMVEVEGDNQWKARGKLGRSQRELLADMLASNKVKACSHRVVYLHHSPFENTIGMELNDALKFKSVLEDAAEKGVTIDALLFGHSHKGPDFSDQWSFVKQCYDGGTITKHRGTLARIFGLKVKAIARLFSLEDQQVRVEEIPLG